MTKLPQQTPENRRLRHECLLLHEELGRLLAERATRLEVVGPALEARYRLAVGTLQLEVLQAECDTRRLRRMLELIQAAINRGAVPDLPEMDAILDAEFAEWQARIGAETARLYAAQAWSRAMPLPPEQVRELQTLFRQLAKRCHPDANPAGGEEARALWLRISAAYAAGDLDALRALALLADGLPHDAGPGADGVRERRDRLRAAVTRLVAELAALETQFPFTLRERLDDPEWMQAQRDTLAARRDQLADERLLLEAAIAQRLAEQRDV